MTEDHKAPENYPTDVTVAIMAGGKSSRMGTDKSFIPFLGKPMIEHVLAVLEGLGNETILITNRPDEYRYLEIPLYQDLIPGKGPLGGLYTALEMSSNEATLVVACDMPWLNRSLLVHMISVRRQADAVIPKWKGYPEPLHAVYNRRCTPAILQCIQENELKMISFVPLIKVRYLDPEEIMMFDRLGRSFANINTPAELAAAESEATEDRPRNSR